MLGFKASLHRQAFFCFSLNLNVFFLTLLSTICVPSLKTYAYTHTYTSTGNLCSVRRVKRYPFCCLCIIKGSVL